MSGMLFALLPLIAAAGEDAQAKRPAPAPKDPFFTSTLPPSELQTK